MANRFYTIWEAMVQALNQNNKNVACNSKLDKRRHI